MKQIDLNCDMAELLPGQQSNYDELIMPYISSANISCGVHSGNLDIMNRTIQVAIKHNVKIGAHPSYNDREHFGRRSLKVPLPELISEIRDQIYTVKNLVEKLGEKLHHVKPHGALYNDMVKDQKLSMAFVQLVKEIDSELIIYGLAHSEMQRFCEEEGLVFYNEAFADRAYEAITQLRDRNLEQSVITKEGEVVSHVERILQGFVRLHNGQIEPIKIDTLCMHSDTPGAVKLTKKIHHFIKSKNIEIGK